MLTAPAIAFLLQPSAQWRLVLAEHLAQRGLVHFNPLSLDAINFLLAGVRGALGPYLNVFLVSRRRLRAGRS